MSASNFNTDMNENIVFYTSATERFRIADALVTTSISIVPATANSYTLGSSSNTFSNTYSVLVTDTSIVTSTSAIFGGSNLPSSPTIVAVQGDSSGYTAQLIVHGTSNQGLELHLGYRTDLLVGFIQADNQALPVTTDLYLQPLGSNIGIGGTLFPLTNNAFDIGKAVNNTIRTIYVGSGIFLPTTGGTASKFGYYEEYSASITCSGVWAASHTGTIRIVKVGAAVTCIMPSITAAFSSTGHITCSNAVPVRMTVTVDIFQPANVLDGSSNANGEFLLDTSGNLSFYNSISGGSFSTGGNSGINQFTASWTTQS